MDGPEDKEVAFVDVESYGNAAFFGCRTESGRVFKAWVTRRDSPAAEYIKGVMEGPYIFVTFNGSRYDLTMINGMIDGRGPHELKHLSNTLVETNAMPWEVEKEFQLPPHLAGVDHIDLNGPGPPFIGLKMCGARMGSRKIMDNPLPHDADLTEEDYPKVEEYCLGGDVPLTEELFRALEKPLLLRCEMSHTYGVDMRSKTDSQMAEAVFIKRLGLRRGKKAEIPPHVRYKAPAWARFRNPEWNSFVDLLQEHPFRVHQGTGHVMTPLFLEPPSKENPGARSVLTSLTGRYQMGVGGLHSIHDKKVCHSAGDGWKIMDIDVASYYPTIIIKADPEILPKHLGARFIEEYSVIYHTRLKAKAAGDKSTADTLRIALNGTFGKTSSKYSPLYSPGLMLYTTLTGQLGLLGAIEALEGAGGIILSANTDGIVVKYHESAEATVKQAVADFSALTGFTFEDTEYRVIAMKDVNNYIAVKAKDRSVKAKGLYAEIDHTLKKNPTNQVCSRAVGEWLARGTPFADTIWATKDITQFLSARNVTGGGVQGGKVLGKVVRLYLSKDRELPPLTYATNGNKVPKTECSRACMVFDPKDGLPQDLDYSAYLKETIKIASEVGAAAFLSQEDLQMIAKPPKKTRKKVAT